MTEPTNAAPRSRQELERVGYSKEQAVYQAIIEERDYFKSALQRIVRAGHLIDAVKIAEVALRDYISEAEVSR